MGDQIRVPTVIVAVNYAKLLSIPRAPKEPPVSALIRNTSEVEDWKLFLEK